MNEDDYGKGGVSKPEDFLLPGSFQHSEIAGAFAPPVWVEKSIDQFDTYPKRNQQQQFSCVIYTLSKQLAVDELSENGVYRELSPRSIYPYVFVPGGGSDSIVAGNLAAKQGMTLEHLLTTDGLTETQVESDTGYYVDAKQVALVYKPDSLIQCSHDFDTIASILQAYKQQGKRKVISILVVGQSNGTWLSPFPNPPSQSNKSPLWYHQVSVTDFGLINGKKKLSFDNSWGDQIGNKGQQFIGEEYLPYIYGGMYTLNQPDNWQQSIPSISKPKHTWNFDLTTGSTGADVLILQQALQSLGMFPISQFVQPTGTFGGITKQAVILFQEAFGIEPASGYVGPHTRAKLNELFAG